MKLLINFADSRFAAAQTLNRETGLGVAGFDQAISYGPGNLDADFARRNQHILAHERGNGYWIWKPYFIVRALSELQTDDFLFYSDSGARFVAAVEPLINACLASGEPVLTFGMPFLEKHWTKRDAFILLGCDNARYAETPQRLASFSLWRKTPAAMDLAQQWLELAQDERLITDLENQMGLPNYAGFREHRHDQSLLSLLAKQRDLPPFRDPSQHGNAALLRFGNSPYDQFIDHFRRKTRSPLRQAWGGLTRRAFQLARLIATPLGLQRNIA